MKPLGLPENPRVLVVALRRLGDVLLTTPLIRSVKRRFRKLRLTRWCLPEPKEF